jgi:hypothetical protein
MPRADIHETRACGVTPMDPELIQIGDAIEQRIV